MFRPKVEIVRADEMGDIAGNSAASIENISKDELDISSLPNSNRTSLISQASSTSIESNTKWEIIFSSHFFQIIFFSIFSILEANHSQNHGLPLFFPTDSYANLCPIYLKLLVHVLLKYGYYSSDFEVNRTKIKSGCQLGRKVVTHDSNLDLFSKF